MDETKKRIFEQVAKEHGVEVKLVSDLWDFMNKRILHILSSLENIVYDQIKLLYIGTYKFNRKHYEFFKRKKEDIKSKSKN